MNFDNSDMIVSILKYFKTERVHRNDSNEKEKKKDNQAESNL